MASTEIRHAWCQMCGPAKTKCSMLCTVEDGRWVGLEGNPAAQNNGGRGGRNLCAKAHASIQTLHDPDRLAYPMKRIGPKGEGPSAFERCTWDEAIDDIAERLAQIKRDHGAAAFGILAPQFFDVLATMGRRFLNVFGSPNYLHSGICALQRRASKTVSIGDGNCAPGRMDQTRLLVSWGSNVENSRVNQGFPAKRLDAMQRGMKVIDIRPMLDPLAAKADLWLPVRPGTDGALALAVLNVIIGEGLHDREFVDEWCHGFDELAQHVRRFTPEWAEPRCGIPAERIREAARLMGTMRPMAIQYGNGIGDQQRDGNWTCIAICLIEAITGNLGIPGGGGAGGPKKKPGVKLRKIDLLSDRLPKSARDEEMGWTAGASELIAPETPRWYQTPATWESGPNSAYFPALMSALSNDPRRLRAALAQSTNPLGATRQPKKTAKALEALELYVVHDTHWNPSCAWADYVLPACSHYECSQQIGVKPVPGGTFVGITQPLAEPMGESRSDWQLYLDLAVALGMGDDFWGGDMDACLRWQLEGTGIDLDELREKGFMVVKPKESACEKSAPAAKVPTDAAKPDYAKLFACLPHGKVQCANDWIGGKPDVRDEGTLPRLPEYFGPPEGLFETPELARKYPLIFSDVHAYHLCTHSYYVGTPYLRELQPYPWVKINPATAERFGIENGDWVRIESPHGWIVLRAELFEGISPDALMGRRGWWQGCGELGLPGYGCFDGGCDPSVLYSTDPKHFDPFHSGMPKQTLVRISRWDGEPPAAAPQGREPLVKPRPALTSEACPEGEIPQAPEGFAIDPMRCIDCHACMVACKQSRRIPAGNPAPCHVDAQVSGSFPDVKMRFIPRPCGACEDPACAATCPTGALRFVGRDRADA